jgi:hypothetical protein
METTGVLKSGEANSNFNMICSKNDNYKVTASSKQEDDVWTPRFLPSPQWVQDILTPSRILT